MSSDIDFLQQGNEADQYLAQLALRSVQGKPIESIGYGVVNEMLIEHRNLRPQGELIIFPQLHLKWNPGKWRDRRANLPDCGLGRLLNGTIFLQGGLKYKPPILPLMADFPDPSTIKSHISNHVKFSLASRQALDQVKAAIKKGAVPYDEVIEWIISIGPYFIIRRFGPFTQAELDTQGHRPDDSGDAAATDLIELAHQFHAIPETMYRIGTTEAAIAVEAFLNAGARLYASNARLCQNVEAMSGVLP